MDFDHPAAQVIIGAISGGAAAALLNMIFEPVVAARRRRTERDEERRLELARICADASNLIISLWLEPEADPATWTEAPGGEYRAVLDVPGLREAANAGYDLGLPRTERDVHRLLRLIVGVNELGQPEDVSEEPLRNALRDAAYLLRRPPWRWVPRVWIRVRLTLRLRKLGVPRTEVPAVREEVPQLPRLVFSRSSQPSDEQAIGPEGAGGHSAEEAGQHGDGVEASMTHADPDVTDPKVGDQADTPLRVSKDDAASGRPVVLEQGAIEEVDPPGKSTPGSS